MVKQHNCTATELGLDGREGAKFMPINEGSVKIVELYKEKLICMAEEDAYIYGDESSAIE